MINFIPRKRTLIVDLDANKAYLTMSILNVPNLSAIPLQRIELTPEEQYITIFDKIFDEQ